MNRFTNKMNTAAFSFAGTFCASASFCASENMPIVMDTMILVSIFCALLVRKVSVVVLLGIVLLVVVRIIMLQLNTPHAGKPC